MSKSLIYLLIAAVVVVIGGIAFNQFTVNETVTTGDGTTITRRRFKKKGDKEALKK